MDQRPQPYNEYFLKVGEKVPFAVDWETWLENRWRNARAYALNAVIRPTHATGLEYKATAGGYSGDQEPIWPLTGTVVDGTITWTAQAVTTGSLTATVSSAPWTAPAGIALSGQALSGQKTSVLVDTSAASAGTDYDVINTATLSDGTIKIATWRIKVR